MIKKEIGKVSRGRKVNREQAAPLAFFFLCLQSYKKPSRKLLALGTGASVVTHRAT